MLTEQNLDNETLLVGPMGTLSVEELRQYFLKKRYSDDEFARDYAKHEFTNWLTDQDYKQL